MSGTLTSLIFECDLTLCSYISKGNHVFACRICSPANLATGTVFTCRSPQAFHIHLVDCIKYAKRRQAPPHKYAEHLRRFENLVTQYVECRTISKKAKLAISASQSPHAAKAQDMLKAMFSGKASTKEELQELLSLLIINDKLPFSFPQSEFFRQFLHKVQQYARSNHMNFTVPARTKMRGLIVEVCQKTNETFMNDSGLRKAIMQNGAGLHFTWMVALMLGEAATRLV